MPIEGPFVVDSLRNLEAPNTARAPVRSSYYFGSTSHWLVRRSAQNLPMYNICSPVVDATRLRSGVTFQLIVIARSRKHSYESQLGSPPWIKKTEETIAYRDKVDASHALITRRGRRYMGSRTALPRKALP